MIARGEVKLRDTRKPGHCWQDNELYDVYQPIIGAYGVVLYANLSRRAYGAECKYSLRELAAETGMGRSTAHRTLAVLECVGMVRMQAGRGSAAGVLELVDLKELAEVHGAEPIQNGKSHLLSSAKTAELRARCDAVRAQMGAWKPIEAEPICVPHGDAKSVENDCGNSPLAFPTGTQVASHGDTSVPVRGRKSGALRKQDTKHKTQAPPLPPTPAAQGDVAREMRALAECDGPIEAVMQACGWTCVRASKERRLRQAIRAQMQLEANRGSPPPTTALAMVERWKLFRESRHLLRHDWSPMNFISEGHWHPEATWAWDPRAVQEQRRRL